VFRWWWILRFNLGYCFLCIVVFCCSMYFWFHLYSLLLALSCIYVWCRCWLGKVVFYICVLACVYVRLSNDFHMFCIALYCVFLLFVMFNCHPMKTLWDLGVGVGNWYVLLGTSLWNFLNFCIAFLVIGDFFCLSELVFDLCWLVCWLVYKQNVHKRTAIYSVMSDLL